MTTTEVYINNMKLDLKPKDVVALTKQINDIGEIQKRNADFTNRITAERTPNNNKIAEMLNLPGNTSTRPYKYANAKIISNGITITSSGIALLVETKNQNTYEYVIYAGNYDLYSKILDKYITDLDWSDLRHRFTMANAVAAKDNTEGYIYPIVDTLDGRLTKVINSTNAIDIRFQVPHVFIKTIWKKIFAEANLQYYGNFFNSYEFNNEAVPADRNYYKDLNIPLDSYNGVRETNDAFGCASGCTDNPIIFDLDVDAQPTPSPNYNFATNEYIVAEGGDYLFNLKIDYNAYFLWEIKVLIKVNGIAVSETLTEPHVRSYPGTKVGSVAATATILLYPGDVVTITYLCDNSNDTGGTSYPWGQIYNVDLQIQQVSTKLFIYNSEIDFSKFLPKRKQLEFLISIMQQYGLIYRLDNLGKYEFITIDDLIKGVAGKEDYSSKFHLETSETYRLGNYDKINKFTYTYFDKDLLGEKYADSAFNIDIDDLDKEGEIIGSSIEACGDYLLFDNWQKIAAIHSYENVESDTTLPPRFELRDNNVLKTVLIVRHQISNTLVNGSYYQYRLYSVGGFFTSELLNGLNYPVAQFELLKWNNLMLKYYPNFIKMLQRPVKKKVLLWLTPIDMYALNMFKIMYLKQYQSYFYLNKINNFIAGKPSDCEIIKIN